MTSILGRAGSRRALAVAGAVAGILILAVAILLAGGLVRAQRLQVAADTEALGADFARAANAYLLEWDDALHTADAVPVEEMGPAVAQLEAIRDAVAALQPPSDVLGAKVSLVRYMDSTIGYQRGIWSKDCEICINEQKVQAVAARERALEDLAALGADLQQ